MLGEDAADVLSSTNISNEGRKKYSTIMEKLNEFFQIRKNVIYERARFNRRVQQADESVEQFITNLYQLAEYCEYGGLKDEMIRDRIMVGIRDTVLSERLQLDSELTLKKAKKLVQQREAVHEHQQFITGKLSSEGAVVEGITKNNARSQHGRGKQTHRRNPQSSGRPPQQQGQQPNQPLCTRCGKGPHPVVLVLQEKLYAISAPRKGTIALCAKLGPLEKCQKNP